VERTPVATISRDRGKEELLEIFTKLVGSGQDLRFLLKLDEASLEQLIVAIRVRLEKTA
jgi:hypothetical protein